MEEMLTIFDEELNPIGAALSLRPSRNSSAPPPGASSIKKGCCMR